MIHNNEIFNGVFLKRENNLWGCVDNTGSTLIPSKYDIVSTRNYGDDIIHILCGHDGYFFKGKHGEKENTIYTGIYDLYDPYGNLLIGGLSDYEYDKGTSTYKLLFGKEWKLYPKGNNSWDYDHYKCTKRGKWMILGNDFTIPFNYSLQYIDNLTGHWFSSKNSLKGGIFQYKDNQLVGEFHGYKSLIPFPKDILFDKMSIINASTICGINNPGCANEERCIIFINKHTKSKFYTWTDTIDEHYTFVYRGRLGLLKDGKEVLPCEFDFMTKPFNDWIFIVKRYPFIPDASTWGKYYVLLYKIKDHYYSDAELRSSIPAINIVDGDTVEQLFHNDAFELHLVGEDPNDLKSYAISKKFSNYFVSTFADLLSKPIEKDTPSYSMWRSADMVEKEKRGKNNDYDDHDYYGLMDALDGEIEAYWNID